MIAPRLAHGLSFTDLYDRAGLVLCEAERAVLAAEGRRPHWRFLLQPETAAWRAYMARIS